MMRFDFGSREEKLNSLHEEGLRTSSRHGFDVLTVKVKPGIRNDDWTSDLISNKSRGIIFGPFDHQDQGIELSRNGCEI